MTQLELDFGEEFARPPEQPNIDVKEHLTEQITKLIMESYDKGVADTKQATIEAIDLAMKLEREACAKVCEETVVKAQDSWDKGFNTASVELAKAIRARGEA